MNGDEDAISQLSRPVSLRRNRTGIFVDTHDNRLVEALTDLLSQSDEFEIQESLVKHQPPAVILLHRDSHDRQSVFVRCQHYRAELPPSSLVILTSDHSKGEEIGELETLADVILRQPFRIRDLIAMMRLQVRDRQWRAHEPLPIGSLTFLSAENLLRNDDGMQSALSDLESRLLHRLYRASGNPVSRDMLLKDVWGYEASVDTATVQVHIHRLRIKLRSLCSGVNFIMTHDDGYSLDAKGDTHSPCHEVKK